MSKSRSQTDGDPAVFSFSDPTPWFVRFQRLHDDFTESEKRVGAYVHEHPEVIHQSISELVEVSKLGYGTIIRFCQKLGCRGFQEFKLLLATEAVRDSGVDGNEEADTLHAIVDHMKGDLQRTFQQLDREQLTRAAKALCNAELAVCVGVASSAPLALNLEWKIKRLGIRSSCISDGYLMGVEASLLNDRCVLAAISSSGTTKDVVSAAQLAKSAGATVIALTNFAKTPLIDVADIRLVTAAARNPLQAEIPSIVAGELVQTMLVEEIKRLDPATEKALLVSFDAIANRKI